MSSKLPLHDLITAALLCAIGIVIPMFSPVKILLEPASFTLASHVPVFIAMFLSPPIALAVALGTSLGFFFGGFPLVVVVRALTHCVFATVGALFLKKQTDLLPSAVKASAFFFCIALLHGTCEVLAVAPFYFDNSMAQGYYNRGFLVSVILLVGVGTVVHSLIDAYIALLIWRPLSKLRTT